MKLHLPKLLFVAVVAAVSSSALAAEVLYEVGTHTGAKNPASNAGNYKVYEGDLTLSGTDKMGTFKDGKLVENSGFGQEKWEYDLRWDMWNSKGWYATSNGTVTKNVQVNGTLKLEGSAQVSLGGQYKTDTDETTAFSVDEFTGLIVNNLEVNDNATLNSWNAIADTMTVNGGTVNIHTYRGEGNLGLRLEGARDSKQVQIKQALNVNGGNVTIGNAEYINSTNKDAEKTQNPETEFHTVVSFGSFSYTGNPSILGNYITGVDSYNINSSKITQSNGNLTVAGKSLSIGGLNIEQTGGTMEISKNTYHFLSDYGDSEIKQSGGTMTLGCLKAYNTYYDSVVTSLKENGQTAEINPSVAITQDGAGVMNLNGVIFTNQKTGAASTEKSSITQSGGGKISLGGEYKGVTFDITQEGKGGTLNINGNLDADVVKQDGAGSIVAASGKTLSANNVYAGTVNEKLDAAGNVTSREASVEISGNVTSGKVTLTDGTLKTDGSTVTNTGNLSVGQIVVNGGTFINERTGNINYTAPSALLALGSDEDNALLLLSGTANTSDVVVAGGKFVNIGNVGNVLVNAGGTLTMKDQSSANSIVMEGGRINVTGKSSVDSLTLSGENNVINFDFSGEIAPSIVLNSGEALDLSATTIMVTVSTEMLENLAGQDFELFGGYVENITNATIIFTDGDNDTTNDKAADVTLGSTSGSIIVTNTHVVPEPTTATLSLLALVGLAARRRRK